MAKTPSQITPTPFPSAIPPSWRSGLFIDLKRFIIVILVLVVYVVGIIPLYSQINDQVFFLSLIPLIIASSLIGTWPGLAVAILLSFFNLYLAQALSESWEGLRGKASVFTLLHLLVATGVGRWRDLNLRLRQELVERKEIESRLEHLAYFDAITGLPNRMLFQDRIETEIEHARRSKGSLSILFLHIEGLKSVIDSLGHEVGDRLFIEIGSRIKRCLRASDTLARFSTETFALLIPRLRDRRDVFSAADKVLQSILQTFFVVGQEIHVTGRFGVATYPDDGGDPETLLRNADAALNQSKLIGTQTFQAYNPSINRAAVERMTLENGIRKALAQEELFLHYQPIVETATGGIASLEALLRWNHPQLGPIPPDAFIPVAEDNGMIHPIGDWVLRTGCNQLKVWKEFGAKELRLAVNVSPRQLRRATLAEDFLNITRSIGVPPGHIDLEITESSLLGQEPQVMENLNLLRNAGFGLALDDFGTGYSCLAYLKRLPLTCLKVDRSFIKEVNTDPEYASITCAIVAMAKALGLKVIAEGVETQEQCSFLWSLQCDEIQGFFFNKPMPHNEVTLLLADIAERRLRMQTPQELLPMDDGIPYGRSLPLSGN